MVFRAFDIELQSGCEWTIFHSFLIEDVIIAHLSCEAQVVGCLTPPCDAVEVLVSIVGTSKFA